MDVETSEALTQLGDRIDALEASLRAEIRNGRAEDRAYTDAKFDQALRHADATFDEALRHTDAKFDEALRHTDDKFDEALRHTDEKFAEVRRHTQVLFESLQHDIRLLADGFAILSAKLDSPRR
jgi:hypothetical protein